MRAHFGLEAVAGRALINLLLVFQFAYSEMQIMSEKNLIKPTKTSIFNAKISAMLER
jgi:hypothetical protein